MGKNSIFMRKTINSLGSMALTVCSEKLLNILESIFDKNNETEAVEQIREYLIMAGTTTPIYQKLLDTILCYKSRAHILAIELLLNPSFKEFRASDCKENDRLAFALATRCASLQLLDLSHLKFDDSQSYLIEEILSNCPNLRAIKLPDSPDNEFWIPLLSTHCPKLRHLSTPSIYRLGILVATYFSTSLTSIECSDYDFDYDEYILEITPIVMQCPNIVTICPDFNLDDVLQKCRSEDRNFSCNLESLTINRTSEAFLNLVLSTCPKLSDLSLCAPPDCSLKILSGLSLRRLDISDFEYQDLLQLIRSIGQNLKILQLRCINKKTIVDLCEITKLCPQLSKLKLVGIDARCLKSFNFPCLLRKFHMYHCQYDKLELKTFLKILQDLEEFFAEEVPFTDEDIQSIFGQHNFNNLQKFFVRKAQNLSIRSVHMLLDFCPNLKYVGQILKWNITREDIKLIPNFKAVHDHVYWEMYVELYND